MQIIADSKVTIQDSQFIRGYGKQGGAIFMLSDSSAFISRTKFQDNVAEK